MMLVADVFRSIQLAFGLPRCVCDPLKEWSPSKHAQAKKGKPAMSPSKLSACVRYSQQRNEDMRLFVPDMVRIKCTFTAKSILKQVLISRKSSPAKPIRPKT